VLQTPNCLDPGDLDAAVVGVPGWSWFGMTPDGAPLFARDVGSQEIYALDVKLP